MKFIVTRTSQYGQGKPCEEAIAERYISVDRRTTDDPLKIPAWKNRPEKVAEEWYGVGSNHRVENGMIVRDMGEQTRWVLEVESLEALMELCKKYGDLVIREDWNEGPIIEIYDDYRE